MNIEDRLRAEIQGCDLSYREIARRAGMNVQVILHFIKGGSIRTDKADALAGVFGLRLTGKDGE